MPTVRVGPAGRRSDCEVTAGRWVRSAGAEDPTNPEVLMVGVEKYEISSQSDREASSIGEPDEFGGPGSDKPDRSAEVADATQDE